MTEEKEYSEKLENAIVVSGVLVKKDNKYLLVQEAKEVAKGLWNLPAGRVEKGTSIEENAIKEAKEETGFDVKLIKEIGIFHNDGDNAVKHVFEAKIIAGELKFSKDEIMDARWFTLDEIVKMKKILRSGWVLGSIELLESKNIADQHLDSWKRCQADFENYKKDQVTHQEEFRKYAKMDVILQILPVVDNFEASLAHVPEKEKDSAWVAGITHIKRQIEDVLRNNGIEEIEVKTGDKFDPEIHEAMAGKGEKIKKVLQKGYRLNGIILRAARVEVG